MAAELNVIASLKAIEALTTSMLLKAKEQQWDELVELEKKRKTFVELVFPLNDSSFRENDEIASLIQHITDSNTELTTLCVQQKHILSEQLQGFNQNKQATKAYNAS
jgi:hypothetical protein